MNEAHATFAVQRRGDIRRERGKFNPFLFTEIERYVTKLELAFYPSLWIPGILRPIFP